MGKNILIILLLIVSSAWGQTIAPQVINSAGKHYTTNVNGAHFSDNIGEPFTETLGPNNNVIVTQGFLQPFIIGRATGSLEVSHVSCQDKKDGSLTVTLTVPATNYSVQYHWTPNSICPSNTCSTVKDLAPGVYKVRVELKYPSGTGLRTDSNTVLTETIKDEFGPCKVKIYNGVTINGDGTNDFWHIDNIEEFPQNEVFIYNRWGQKIYDARNYNNVDNYWPKKEDIGKLISSTYFYVINLNDGSKPLKGWVELIKN